jgi:hypothetical protein
MNWLHFRNDHGGVSAVNLDAFQSLNLSRDRAGVLIVGLYDGTVHDGFGGVQTFRGETADRFCAAYRARYGADLRKELPDGN